MNETLLTRAEESIQHGLALLLMSSYGITEAEAKQTVTRIADMIQHSDEPRFSLYDYVDALANWNDPLDIRALMKLDDTKFFILYPGSENRNLSHASWNLLFDILKSSLFLICQY